MASAQIVLPVPDGPGEVEGQRQAGRMTLAQPPAVENQIVARDLRQRLIERPPRRRRQHHIVERAPGDDGLHRAAVAGQIAEDTKQWIGHGLFAWLAIGSGRVKRRAARHAGQSADNRQTAAERARQAISLFYRMHARWPTPRCSGSSARRSTRWSGRCSRTARSSPRSCAGACRTIRCGRSPTSICCSSPSTTRRWKPGIARCTPTG